MLNEVQAVSAVALFAVLVFFIGSNINRKKLDRYSRWLQDRAGDTRVKYAPYGTDGFRARIVYEKGPFTQLDFALKLVDRYNFMHYFLRFYTKDSDALAVWCSFRDPEKKSLLIEKLKTFSPKEIADEGKRVRAVLEDIDDKKVLAAYDAVLKL